MDKNFIENKYKEYTQIDNARHCLKNIGNISREEVLTENAINKYGITTFRTILKSFIKEYKDSPKKLQEISDFAEKHPGALHHNTKTLIDKYLKEEADKKTFLGGIVNAFKTLVGWETAHKKFNASLPKYPEEEILSKINETKDKIEKGQYSPFENKALNAIKCARGDIPYDQEIYTKCVSGIIDGHTSDKDRISSLKAMQDIITKSTVLNEEQKESASKPFEQALEKLEGKGAFVSKVKEQEAAKDKSTGGRDF